MDKQIRFIDSNYNELFDIPDGGSISITFNDGNQAVRQCKYIDSHHFSIAGGDVYHICQFAETMERNGNKYEPETTPEIVVGYHVVERMRAGNKMFVMAENPNAVEPYVTWVKHHGREGYDWGKYFSNRSDAYSDLIRRVYDEKDKAVPSYKPKNIERER